MTTRLDTLLQRNRRSRIADLVLPVFFVVGALFTGMAIGEELPNLTAPVAAASSAGATDDAPAPVRVARR
ncbi:MAG TPA: hypothetical protein VIG06_04995 [Kofleriaceae bacterium]